MVLVDKLLTAAEESLLRLGHRMHSWDALPLGGGPEPEPRENGLVDVAELRKRAELGVLVSLLLQFMPCIF